MNSRLGLLFRLVVFKDLQKLVSQQQRDNRRKELFERLRNKPFWVWDIAEHKQEDRLDIFITDICDNNSSIR